MARVRELLRQHAPGADRLEDEDLRGFEWYYVNRLCHSDLLTIPGHALAFSPDGRHIALVTSADHRRAILLWDVMEGRESRRFECSGYSNAAAFSPDGRFFAAGGGSGGGEAQLLLWEVASGRRLHDLRWPLTYVVDLTFSPDGRRIVATSAENSMRTWDVQTGRPGPTTMATNLTLFDSIAFSPDGSTLATLESDGMVRLWDPKSGRVIRDRDRSPLLPTKRSRGSCVFSPDGRWLAATGPEGTVQIRDVPTWTVTGTLRGTGGATACVAFNPDGGRLAVGEDQVVHVWDTTTGQLLRTYRGHEAAIDRVAFWPDAGCIVSSGRDHTVRFWDARGEQESVTIPGCGLAMSSNERLAATIETWELHKVAGGNLVRIWDLETGQERLTIRGRPVVNEPPVFDRDGRRLAVGVQGAIQVWDASRGEELLRIRGFPRARPLAFSPDGARLIGLAEKQQASQVTFGGLPLVSSNLEIRIWDASSGRLIRAHDAQFGEEQPGLQFLSSPDGLRVALIRHSDDSIRVVDPEDGRDRFILSHRDLRLWSIIASPSDGRWIATTASRRADAGRLVVLWDATTGRELSSFSVGESHVSPLAISSDGSRFISKGSEAAPHLWDVVKGDTPWGATPIATASEAAPRGEGPQPIISAGSPPIATASEAAPHLWDVATGLDLFALPGRAHELIMSPDGHRLAGGYGDQKDRNSVIWDARTESSDARARRVAARESGPSWNAPRVGKASLTGRNWPAGSGVIPCSGRGIAGSRWRCWTISATRPSSARPTAGWPRCSPSR